MKICRHVYDTPVTQTFWKKRRFLSLFSKYKFTVYRETSEVCTKCGHVHRYNRIYL